MSVMAQLLAFVTPNQTNVLVGLPWLGGVDPSSRAGPGGGLLLLFVTAVFFFFVFTISSGAIYLHITKQRSVADSTTEAEYIALSIAFRQAIWTRQVISSIKKTPEDSPVPLLFGDIKASLPKGVSNISRIKHIDTSFHQIVDEVKKGSIKLFWNPCKEMGMYSC